MKRYTAERNTQVRSAMNDVVALAKFFVQHAHVLAAVAHVVLHFVAMLRCAINLRPQTGRSKKR